MKGRPLDINDLTIGQARELTTLLGASTAPAQAIDAHLIGKAVIVRTYSAGVHFGTLAARNGTEVRLTATRRIWYWNKAFTLSKIAADGLDASSSKLSVFVPEIILTEAIEVIPVTPAANKNLLEAPAHKPE